MRLIVLVSAAFALGLLAASADVPTPATLTTSKPYGVLLDSGPAAGHITPRPPHLLEAEIKGGNSQKRTRTRVDRLILGDALRTLRGWTPTISPPPTS